MFILCLQYQDAMQFQMNHFGKPGLTYIAVNSSEEAQRIMQHEKHMHNKYHHHPGNAYVEMFIAH